MKEATRRKFLLASGVVLAAPRQLLGQPSKSLPRVTVVFTGSKEAHATQSAAFIRGMREHGYMDGSNVALDLHYADGSIDKQSSIIQERLALKPDAIVLIGSQAARAAQKATSTIPIVMATFADPVGQGFAASLARPGGNLTGQSLLTEILVSKRLELLKEILPKTVRVGHLVNSTNPAMTNLRKQGEAAAAKLGIELLEFDARDSTELDTALASIAGQRLPAVTVFEDVLFFSNYKKIAASLLKSRIPSIFGFREGAIEGGVMSYSANFDEFLRHSATYVSKILKGAKPGELPIEQAMFFELIVNQKSAKTLGITIPQSVLLRADRVIE